MATGPLETAGDIAAAATALSGLILVYMGMVTTSYEAFDEEGKQAAKKKIKFRMRVALAGIYLALAAALTAISGKWFKEEFLVSIGFYCLALSLLVILVSVTIAYMDID